MVTASGTATGMARRLIEGVQLSSGLYVVDLDDAIGGATFDFRTGAVSEFSFPAVDRDGRLSRRGLLREGVNLTWNGTPWQIVAIDRDYRGADIWLTYTARSRLARRLRNMAGDRTAEKQTPQAWITSRVKRAGGVAVVQPGAGRVRIVQKRNQSVLDVIAALASDTGVEWVEFDGTFYVGTPWWAFQGKTGLPTWKASADGSGPLIDVGNALSVTALSSRSSLDDRQNAAEASMTVEAARGRLVRPWHRVDITRADDADRGIWLVRDVQFAEGAESASLSLIRPLKSSPKSGSSGSPTGGEGGTSFATSPAALDGEWIQGADRKWPGCTRTPRQIVEWARGQVGSSWPDRQCLRWVSHAVRGADGAGGYYAFYVWKYAPAGTPKAEGDTNPPIGAIVVWYPPTGGAAGHIGISVGGGRVISASGGRVIETSISAFGNLKGAMAPNFGGNYPNHGGG